MERGTVGRRLDLDLSMGRAFLDLGLPRSVVQESPSTFRVLPLLIQI